MCNKRDKSNDHVLLVESIIIASGYGIHGANINRQLPPLAQEWCLITANKLKGTYPSVSVLGRFADALVSHKLVHDPESIGM